MIVLAPHKKPKVNLGNENFLREFIRFNTDFISRMISFRISFMSMNFENLKKNFIIDTITFLCLFFRNLEISLKVNYIIK